MPTPPDIEDETSQFDMQSLTKLGMWGGAAAAGLLFVAIAAHTEAGQRRLALVFQGGNAQVQITALDEGKRATLRDAEIENRRLADQLRNLAGDRDRIVARMTALERNYEDVTGSIGKLNKPPTPEAKPAAPAPQAAAPQPPAPEIAPVASIPAAASERAVPVAAPQPAQIAAQPAVPGAAPVTAPAPPPAPAAVVPMVAAAPQAAPSAAEPTEGAPARTEFGVDLGGAPNVAALRNHWERIRRTHSSSLEGLRPVIGIRDGRSGQVELRLVVGPISNASNAAKLCATLAMGGLSCQPTTFDGQRLALR